MWFAVVAAAGATLDGVDLVQVDGWTADGDAVVQVKQRGDTAAVDRVALVLHGDVVVERFVLASQRGTALQDAAWATWRNAHPLAAPTQALAGSTGARLEVRGPDTWAARDRLVVTEGPRRDSDLGLSRAGDGFWAVGQVVLDLDGRVSAWWSADGRRVVIAAEAEGRTSLFTPKPVLIGVLAPPNSTSADGVAAAVAPFGLVDRGEAKAARDHTTVYFAQGFEADARAIAAAIAGSTVAPMDWAGAQHVVVAVGGAK